MKAVPISVNVVYNDQTKFIADAIKKQSKKSDTLITFENIDSDYYSGDFYVADSIILNLVSYFPESYNTDAEIIHSHNQNVDIIRHLGLLNAMVINIGFNNSMFLALNDRINDSKIEIFMNSKIEQLYTLATLNRWINVECGFILTDKFKQYISEDKTFTLNSSFNINPVEIDQLLAAITCVINNPDKYINSTIQLISKVSKTMFSFVKGKKETPKLLESVDFINELPSYQTYIKRFKP